MEPKSELRYSTSIPVSIPPRELQNYQDASDQLSGSIDGIARRRIGLSTSPEAAVYKIDGLMGLAGDIDAKILDLLIEKTNSLIEAYKLGADSKDQQQVIRETIQTIQNNVQKNIENRHPVCVRAADFFYAMTRIFKDNANWQWDALSYANCGRTLCKMNNNDKLFDELTHFATSIITGGCFR